MAKQRQQDPRGATAQSATGGQRRGVNILCVLATLLGGMSVAAAQTQYRVTALEALPGYGCAATNVNDSGDVVGLCSGNVGTFAQVGVKWRGGVVSLVTPAGGFPGGHYSMATAINASGTVVGDGDTGNFRPQSWVTTPTGLVNIFPNNGGNTHAMHIADNGVIGGYYTKSLSGNTSSWKGALWVRDAKDPRKYRTIDLPVLPGGIDPKSTSSISFAFNQVGQAAGYATNDQIGQHAAFWNNDAAHSVVDLGVYGDDWSSLAWGINDLGQVAGSSHPPFGSRAVVWNNDAAHTPQALPALPGDNYGSATALNNVGQVIGTSYYGTPGTWDATPARMVVWRDGGVFEINAVLDAASGTGWRVDSVSAINNLGQIVGSATGPDGQSHAVLLTPQQ